MTNTQNTIPFKYQQPVRDYTDRKLFGSLEQVDYVPASHLRIWYNRQQEGYALHHHNAMEIIVCMENQYIITADSIRYYLNAGDILIIPPNMLHAIEDNPGGIRFIGLFDTALLDYFQDAKVLEPVFMAPCLCSKATQPEIYPDIYEAFMQIIDCYFSGPVLWEFSIFSTLLDILVTLGREYYTRQLSQTNAIQDGNSAESYKKFPNLLHYIDDHYADELTLDMAADYVGFSKYHFSRLFKQYTNSTFYDYLSHKRIQSAQKLLSSPVSVTDIAFQTGFNSLSTFCRCFKKYTRLSPTEYRSLWADSTLHAP